MSVHSVPNRDPAPAPVRSSSSDDEFAATTRPHLDRLAAVARRILGDADLASDAVQEALLSLWLEREQPADLLAWLIRAVANRSLHLARSRSRRRKHEDRERRNRPELCDHDDPARGLERDDVRRMIREALDQIVPEYRAVLILANIEERDYESIAAELGVPVGTVRSRLHRARRALRDVLLRALPEERLGLD